MAEEMRLQKYLSQAGVCSRRTAEEYLVAGRIRVNGKVVQELGTSVLPGRDKVEVDGRVIEVNETYIYILLHKPAGYISSLNDPEGRPVVTDLLPRNMPRLWPVGRLDWDSEGALLMTNDGRLTNLLTHPAHDAPKRYAVKMRGLLTDDHPALAQLREGVTLDDGEFAKPATASVVRDNGRNTWVEMIIHEGKNRQIRRMCDVVGHPVMKLRRISIGTVTIEGLPSGSFRSLTHEEVVDLYGDFELRVPEEARPSRRAQKRARESKERNGRPAVRRVRQHVRTRAADKTGEKAVARPGEPGAEKSAEKPARTSARGTTGPAKAAAGKSPRAAGTRGPGAGYTGKGRADAKRDARVQSMTRSAAKNAEGSESSAPRPPSSAPDKGRAQGPADPARGKSPRPGAGSDRPRKGDGPASSASPRASQKSAPGAKGSAAKPTGGKPAGASSKNPKSSGRPAAKGQGRSQAPRSASGNGRSGAKPGSKSPKPSGK